MVPHDPTPRMLTDDEREILKVFAAADPIDYPVSFRQSEERFDWYYLSARSPILFDTRDAAVESFARFITYLSSAARVEVERPILVDPLVADARLENSRDA